MTARSTKPLWIGLVVIALAFAAVLAVKFKPWRRPVVALPVPSASASTEGPNPGLSARGALDGRGHVIHLTGRDRIECNACHVIQADRFDKPDATKCATCHGEKKVTIHDVKDPPAVRDCLACHSFVPHDSDAKAPWRCMDCHGVGQPETEGPQSAWTAPIVLSTKVVTVHGGLPCGDCHRPHMDPATSARGCGCHRGDRAPKHPVKLVTKDPAGREKTCLSCHKPHESIGGGDGAADSSCKTCHSKQKPIVAASATFGWGHKACTGCHTSHEGGAKAKTSACPTCHAEQVTMGAEKGGKHSDCRSCHTPHAVRTGSGTCFKCHATPHGGQAADLGTSCLGCHRVHARKKGTSAVGLALPGTFACSNKGCHEKAASDTAFHAGGLSCRGCHTPHGGEAKPPKECSTCHKTQSTAVASNTGHSNCRKCHTPHAPTTPKPPCATCHATEASTAPKGHSNCKQCHDTHSGVVGSTCPTCHTNKKNALHGATKGGCQQCHRPHGPKGVATPPVCTTCHSPEKLPSLHAEKKHQTCTACHSSHSPPRADRTTCTACHKDRVDHEPDAKKCTACHAFGGGK